MKVFKISGKFEQNGEWSDREADFVGYFIKRLDDDDVIEGYVEEQFQTPYDPIRYIIGLYIDARKLVFLNMCNDIDLSPLCYSFPNVNEQGFWSGFDFNYGFFVDGHHNGHATLKLNEITSDAEKTELSMKVNDLYGERVMMASGMSRMLMADFRSLVDFIEPNSKWYPHD